MISCYKRCLQVAESEETPVVFTQPTKCHDLLVRPITALPFVTPGVKYCEGLERLNNMRKIYLDPSPSLFNFLYYWCPFITTTNFDVFHQPTLAPIFTVTQLSNPWMKTHNLQYLVNHNDYSGPTRRTDLCLVVNCEEFYEGRLLHNAEFLLAEGDIKLGSCEYISKDRRNPILKVECYLTHEIFTVSSSDFTPGYRDSDFMVMNNEGSGCSLAARISRQVPTVIRGHPDCPRYPKYERTFISFTRNVHPYTKGVLLATAIILKHDIFK